MTPPLLRTASSASTHTAKGRSWRHPFGGTTRRADIGREVLAGILGWMAVVSSIGFYASLLVGDEADKNSTLEIYMLVAGLSTMAFGLTTNMPFIVAPSVLYAAREAGITIGGHLAAQAIANAAATVAFMFSVKLHLVSYMPTALRVGAGCGISMLVGVLGMRSIGLLVANTFELQPFTWEAGIGLAVITAGFMTLPPAFATKKWMYIAGLPMALTVLVYGIVDRTKFQGYSTAENPPLSNWRGGAFGLVDFSQIKKFPGVYSFYILRTFLSIIINISSILLVLIDSVCLEKVRGKVKSSGEEDFSNAIGGTNKFRLMVCAIPFMSCIGNLVGVTTQAAFVQSMIIVFGGGKTGLSAVVTGGLLVMTTVLWPILPLLVPGHISGALTIIITLRFFTVIRTIDVTKSSNLLMFGVSILLIPLSFDFVDALCIATVLGFLCDFFSNVLMQGVPWKRNRVVVSSIEHEIGLVSSQGDEAGLSSPSNASGGNHQLASGKAYLRETNTGASHEGAAAIPLQATSTNCSAPNVLKHETFSDVSPSSLPTSPSGDVEEAVSKGLTGTWGRLYGKLHGHAVLPTLSRLNSQDALSPRSTAGQERAVNVSMPPALTFKHSATAVNPSSPGEHDTSREAEPGKSGMGKKRSPIAPHSVHWGLAFVAMIELVLKMINDGTKEE